MLGLAGLIPAKPRFLSRPAGRPICHRSHNEDSMVESHTYVYKPDAQQHTMRHARKLATAQRPSPWPCKASTHCACVHASGRPNASRATSAPLTKTKLYTRQTTGLSLQERSTLAARLIRRVHHAASLERRRPTRHTPRLTSCPWRRAHGGARRRPPRGDAAPHGGGGGGRHPPPPRRRSCASS